MRRKIVAGNWKMNTNLQEGIELIEKINKTADERLPNEVELIVAPPFTHLSAVQNAAGERIGVAAQNCSTELSGAYTGEVSALMIKSTGAGYVIIGHSERRSYFNETDELLNKKILTALETELIPIVCCGENLDEREKGIYTQVVREQLEKSFSGLSKEQFNKVIIAYEPVWAIGTGVTASADQAQEMHKFIRDLISEIYDSETAESTPILYGGSCKPSNASELFANPDVDGGLIGGASLNADDFIDIACSFQ